MARRTGLLLGRRWFWAGLSGAKYLFRKKALLGNQDRLTSVAREALARQARLAPSLFVLNSACRVTPHRDH